MKKLIIPLMFVSCNTYKPYSPHKLKQISEDIYTLQDHIQKDYELDLIEEGWARNYYNILETLAYQVEKEYNKADKKKKEYTK